MNLLAEYEEQSSFIYDRIKSSWTKTHRISAEHKKRLIEIFKTDGDQIKALMESLGQKVGTLMDEESERDVAKPLRERINERITDSICDFFLLPLESWLTDEEVARKALLNLEVKERQLKAYIN